MTRLTLWTPPGAPRPLDPRLVRQTLDGLLRLNHSWRTQNETLVAGQAVVGTRPAGPGAPLTVSSAGWIYADPVRLLTHARADQLWWTYLAGLASRAVDLELPVLAARWVADELRAQGVTRWKDAHEHHAQTLEQLRGVASAALVVVADGEFHAKKQSVVRDLSDAPLWASMLRPDFGQLGWKEALRGVQSGHWTLQEIEPWGPMLDVSGIMPDPGIDSASGVMKDQLKALRRAVQGQARSAPSAPAPLPAAGRRGVQVAPDALLPERQADWAHEHPETEAL